MKRISKSDYIAGTICPKRLWLSHNKPAVCENTSTLHTEEGTQVGELARRYFEGSYTIPLMHSEEMAAETKRQLSLGRKIICEATFIAEGLSCSADIVVSTPEGLDVIEVKSSTSVKSIQIQDITFQCFVINQAGYHIHSVKIMYLNGEYVRHGDLDLKKLFVLKDMDFDIKENIRDVMDQIRSQNELVALSEEPAAELSCRCEKPYCCPCLSYCMAQAGIPEKSVFSLPGVSAKKKYELYRRGYVTMDDLLTARACLTENQMRKVIQLNEASEEVIVDREHVIQFLRTVRFPLYLLDFETMQQAIPAYDGISPYMQIPFQYSLHILAEDGGLSHKEFLAEEGTDPRRALAEHLCHDIPQDVESMAYNFSFEKSVCRHLAADYPDLAPHLLNITENMIDLMVPFKEGWVTTAKMHGSYSIKAVLPALCGNDKELDYHALPVVHNGAEAMATFASLHLIKDCNERQHIRDGLLKYCRLDTLAMVKVLQKLIELIQEENKEVLQKC